MANGPKSLLAWCIEHTAFGLLRGKRYTALKGSYMLLAGQEDLGAWSLEKAFYVALVDIAEDDKNCLFQRQFQNPFHAAFTMLKIWHQLKEKLDPPQEKKDYIRSEAP